MATWKQTLKEYYRNPSSLQRHGYAANEDAHDLFKTLAPSSFVRNAPIALQRQVLPSIEETVRHTDFTSDPLQEQNVRSNNGVLKKYCGRVLVTLTGTCAIHCRYCFRRHFDYPAVDPTTVADEIKQDTSITEVILSGGDPLMVSDEKLKLFLASVSSIKHITTIRFHTRVPVVLPERITDELVALLTDVKKNLVFVIHSNHAAELTQQASEALQKIKPHVAMMLNQSVLLKGVNDSSTTLAALSYALAENSVVPYYLHQLDKVSGASHFFVPIVTGKEIMRELTKKLPGYLVPRYVFEQPGAAAKRPIWY